MPCALAQRTITLDSAIAFSYEHSPLLRASGLNIEEAHLAAREAALNPYPGLRYNLGASYAPQSQNFGYDPTITNEGQLNAQLTMQATIYNGGAFGLRKQQAALDISHAQSGLSLTREDLRFDVTQSFLDDLRARMSITIERETVQELQTYRDLVDRLFHGGTSAYTDLLKTDVQLGEEKISLHKAEADEVQARFALAALFGTPTDTSFSVQGAFDSVFSGDAFKMGSYDSLVMLTISIAENELQRAKLDVELARAQAKPTLDANVDAGLLTSMENITAPPGERFPFWGVSAGISLQGPIFDWGLNKTQVEEKEAIVEILQSQLNEQKRELAAQITQILILLRSAQTRLAEVRANLIKARDSYDLERAQYAVGGALASEVLDAQKQVHDERTSELQILSDMESYRSQLRHLTAAPPPNTSGNANSDNTNTNTNSKDQK
ncbi:MAG TPA: TolC family protein [Candidatus Kapabacteria bacterium]